MSVNWVFMSNVIVFLRIFEELRFFFRGILPFPIIPALTKHVRRHLIYLNWGDSNVAGGYGSLLALDYANSLSNYSCIMYSLWPFQANLPVLFYFFRQPQSPLILFKAQEGNSGAFKTAFFGKVCFSMNKKNAFTWLISPEIAIMKTGLCSIPFVTTLLLQGTIFCSSRKSVIL